jgi:hypothetical protein
MERRESLGCRIGTSSSLSHDPRPERGGIHGMGTSSALSASEAAAVGC